MTDELFDRLKALATPSKVGKGDQLVMDLSSRKAHEITNFVPDPLFLENLRESLSELKKKMGLEEELSLRFHKLTMYGGMFRNLGLQEFSAMKEKNKAVNQLPLLFKAETDYSELPLFVR